MAKPRIVKIGKKRYLQLGKKRIKVASSISERELVKWIIKYLHPKRKRRGKATGSAGKTMAREGFNRTGVASYPDLQTRDKQEKLSTQLALLESKVNREQKAQAAILPQQNDMVPMAYVRDGMNQVNKVLMDQNNEIRRGRKELGELKEEKEKENADLLQVLADLDYTKKQKDDILRELDEKVSKGIEENTKVKEKHEKAEKKYRDTELLRKKIEDTSKSINKKASKAVGKIIAD
jgi:septal ring factor EnvC (AmiA/AmiB activator)